MLSLITKIPWIFHVFSSTKIYHTNISPLSEEKLNLSGCTLIFTQNISRIPDQNGISQACYIVEIYHSGPESSISWCGSSICVKFSSWTIPQRSVQNSMTFPWHLTQNKSSGPFQVWKFVFPNLLTFPVFYELYKPKMQVLKVTGMTWPVATTGSWH